MLLALIIAIAAGTPSELKNSANFVFTEFQNTGFWTNNGWAFMLSFLTPVWVVSGFESAATIAEEASNAAKAVPFAMVSSLVTATVTGWAVIITIAFCMGSYVIKYCHITLRSAIKLLYIDGGSFERNVCLCERSVNTFDHLKLVIDCERKLTQTSSRPRPPSSSYLRVLSSNKTPIRAISFIVLCIPAEGLLKLVNTVAINSIFNLAIMGLYFAYCMPLISRLLFRRFTPGVWYMSDRISYISAFTRSLDDFYFHSVTFSNVSGSGYPGNELCGCDIGVCVGFCVVHYWFPHHRGKTFFKGPVRTIDEALGERGDVRETVVSAIEGEMNMESDSKDKEREKIMLNRRV